MMSSSLIRRLESPSAGAAVSVWEAAGAWVCGAAKGVLKGLWVLGTPSNEGTLPAGALVSCAEAAGAAAVAGAAVASV